jgi:hypothetical protein
MPAFVEARYSDDSIDVGIRPIDTAEICSGDVDDIAFRYAVSVKLQEPVADRDIAVWPLNDLLPDLSTAPRLRGVEMIREYGVSATDTVAGPALEEIHEPQTVVIRHAPQDGFPTSVTATYSANEIQISVELDNPAGDASTAVHAIRALLREPIDGRQVTVLAAE